MYSLIAKEYGFPVSENILDDAITFVNENIKAYYSETSPEHVSNQRAYMLYVVSRAGWGSTSRIDNLFQNRDNLSLYGKALLMQAMQNKEMSTSDINILKNELVDAAILSATGVHWEENYHDYYNWGSDTRTTSIVMNALLHTDPDLEILPEAIRWLMVNRTANSHWYSTQETAWVLRGLVDWLDISDDFSADYEYLINLNGEELFRGAANTDNISTPVLTTTALEQTALEELEYLEISRDDGPGNLYYSMYASVTLPAKDVAALSNGITITREYYQLDDLETPVTEAAQGDIIQVRITIVAPNNLHYVIINDPLPAGLASLDQNLLTNPQIPSTFTYEDMYSSGWGWWYFDHTEMYDEKTTISADYLPAGTYMYVYYARAATPGTYSVIPTTAAEFYFPDVFGRADGSEFIVTPGD